MASRPRASRCRRQSWTPLAPASTPRWPSPFIAAMGGRFLIPVSAEVRGNAGVAAGDAVEVDVAVDSEPRTVEVPADLAAALEASGSARRAFDALSYSNQARQVGAAEGAKSQETRQRRIAKVLAELAGC